MQNFNSKLSAEERLKIHITQTLQTIYGDPQDGTVYDLVYIAQAYHIDKIQEQQAETQRKTEELIAKTFPGGISLTEE